MARYWCAGAMARALGETFPWGTLVVNAGGCAFIGWFAGVTAPEGRLLAPPLARQFVVVGVGGGFTTFSSFGIRTLRLSEDLPLLEEMMGRGLVALERVKVLRHGTPAGS
jgi:CrcB protein